MSDLTLSEARLGRKPLPVMLEASNRPRLVGAHGELTLFDVYLQIDLAHVTMLAECGIIPETLAARLLGGLRKLRAAGPEGLEVDPARGTLLLHVEHHLDRSVGEDAAGMLQLARSRIDQGAAAMRVATRNKLLDVAAMTLALQEALLERAGEWRDVVLPGYTHLQPAQPAVLGHYLLAQFDVFGRDVERLFQTYERVNRSALGAAAMSGAGYPIDRQRTADLLGHGEIIGNARDASYVTGMEYLAEIAATLSLAMGGCGRLASDFYIWNSREFALIELDPGLCGTSSAMPQKRNPNVLERIRALSGEALGWMPAQLGLLRSPTSTDCDVNFSSNEHLGYLEAAGWALRLMTATVRGLAVDRERMAELASEGWSTASGLADQIVQRAGLDFRRAHRIVAALVREAGAKGLGPDSVTGAELDRIAMEMIGRPVQLTDDTVRESLEVTTFVNARTSAGGISAKEVERLLEAARVRLVRDQERLQAEQARLVTAEQALERAVDAICGPAS